MGKKKAKTGGSISTIFGTVVFVVLFAWYLIYSTNLIVGYVLESTYPHYLNSHQFAIPHFTGGFSARNVSIDMDDTDTVGDGNVIRMDKVYIKVPFLDWALFLANKAKSRTLHRIDNMRVEFEGVETIGWVGLSDELTYAGDSTASPFDAEGCIQDNFWVSGELSNMGLISGKAKLMFEWRTDGDRMFLSQVMEVPELSKIEYIGEYKTNKSGWFESWDDLTIISENWTIVDEGFVKARNAYCAKKDNVTENIVIERHIAAVDRYLKSQGIAVSSQAKNIYQSFVKNGGTLVLSTNYSPRLSQAEDAEIYSDIAQYITGSLSTEKKTAALNITKRTPSFWPDDEDSLTTYEIMLREGSLPKHLIQDITLITKISENNSAEKLINETEAIEENANSEELGEKPNLVSKIGGNLELNTDNTANVTEQVSTIQSKESDSKLLTFEQLQQYQGYVILLNREGYKTMKVEILDADNDAARVRHSYNSGWMEFEISPIGFLDARLIK